MIYTGLGITKVILRLFFYILPVKSDLSLQICLQKKRADIMKIVDREKQNM